MAKRYLTSIDLSKNQILNVAIHNLSSAPTSPVFGQLYYNTISNRIFFYNGTTWVDMTGAIQNIAGGAGLTASSIVNGTVTLDINVDNATVEINNDILRIKDLGITSSKINDGAITTIKIAGNNVTLNKLQQISSYTALGNVTGSQADVSQVVIVTDLANASTTTLATSTAIKTYIDTTVGGIGNLEGSWDASTGTFPVGSTPVAGTKKGDYWYVTTAGTVGGVSFNIGDVIIAKVNSASTTLASDWIQLEVNRDQATETVLGIIRLATQSELTAGTNDTAAVTPFKLKTYLTGNPFNYLTGNQSISLTGAITGSGTTAITTSLATGIVGISNLSATGTPSASTYLRGDNTWASILTGGTVTSVAALTLGTSGTDLSSSVANGTTTPVITLNVPSASATNRGVLTPTDWSTFNSKQGALTLTTTGTSGASTLVGNTLNIPAYTSNAGTVTSVGLSMPAAFTVTNSPVTSSGTLTVVGAGTSAQYVTGDGNLATFPSSIASASQMTTFGRNSTGSTLYRGTIVYISTSTGNLPNFTKSLASGESTSARTFGVIKDDIANNADGYVVSIGTIDNLDTRTGANGATNPFTNDTLADGDTVFLSPTTPGYITNVKPSAPNHLVYIGKVIRTSPTNGTIVYQIQNGFELDELHDVQVGSYVNKDILYRDTATNLWKNASIATVLGYTPYNATNPNSYIALTGLSSTATGLTYTNTTGVFSLTSGYVIPTTTQESNWDNAYTNRITSLTTTGNSGAATLVSNVLNVPNYTLSGLGGVPTSRTLTINGTAYDLTADRSWTISAGSSTLSALTDVVLTSPQNNDVLKYDTATGKWINGVGGAAGNYVTVDTTQTVTGVKTFRGSSTDETPTFGTSILSSGGWATGVTGWTGSYPSWTVVGAGSSPMTNTSVIGIINIFYVLTITATTSVAGKYLSCTFGGSSFFVYFSSTGTQTVSVGAVITTSASLSISATGFDGTISAIDIKSRNNFLNPATTFATSAGGNPIEVRVDTVTNSYNTFFGYRVGRSIWNGTKNTGFGNDVLSLVQTGYNNVAIGYYSQNGNVSAYQNTSLGANTLSSNVSGQDNTAIGNGVLGAFKGSFSTFVGSYSGSQLTGGSSNIGIGAFALVGTSNSTPSGNIAIGYSALYNAASNSYNVAVGYSALEKINAGSNNIALGYRSAYFISGGVTNATTIDNSIFIGYQTYPLANSQTNQIVIGYNVVGLGSNTTSIGNSSTTLTYLYGSLQQTAVTSSMIKVDSVGKIVAAVAGTDYLTSVSVSNINATGTPSSTTYLRGDGTWSTISGGAGGTVTSVSVVSANGFAGTVATATATPAITLTTTVTGLLKGNGTAISAAVAGTDYLTSSDLSGYLTSATAASTYQPLDADLTAIAGLAGTSGLLKKTAANSWTLDTNTYLTSYIETDPVWTSEKTNYYTKTEGDARYLQSYTEIYQGTVTSVAALTLGTTGTDLSSSVATGTTTPVITLNVPTASASNRGALSAADWSTFNGKQAGSTNLTSLSGLTYASASFVKMTAAGTFALDTNTYYLASNPNGYTTNTGTVTTVSVVSANGFAGTVATDATTPAITLSTTITGLLKGNGTAISAATANTDYLAVNNPVYTGTLSTGTLTYTPANLFLSAQRSQNSFIQAVFQNTNAGATASSDVVVNNNLSTDTTYYGDFGINGSAFTGSGSLTLANAVYLTATTGDLVLGTTTSNAVHIVVNSGATDAVTIKTTGQFQLPGYTSTSSFTGTAAGYLAFDSSGNILSVAAPSGGGGYTVTTQTTTYSVTATSGTTIVKGDTTGGTFTITLPTAVDNTATIMIKKTAGTAALVVDGAGTETIDSGLTATLNKINESIMLISDNANWQIV